MKTIIKKLLKEALLPESYHITNISNILDILESNSINLSTSLGSKSDQFGNKFFFLSFSRTKSLKLGYKAGEKNIGIIVFNGNKLNNNFKSIPVDYWGAKNVTKSNEWWASRYEYEERLISDKPIINNLSNYIIRIDMLYDFKNTFTIPILKKIIKIGKSRNVDINIYSDEKDLMLKRNKINDEIINYSDDLDIGRDEYKISDRYENILSLLLFNYKYLDDYDLFKLDLNKFLTEYNLTEDDVNINKIYDKMRYLTYNDIDLISGLSADISNYFKLGKSGKYRELIGLLGNKLRKAKASSIKEYIDLLILGKRPKLDNSYKNIVYKLYNLEYNYDTSEYDSWVLVDKDKELKELSDLYFGGYLGDDDMDVFFKYRNNGKTIGDFIKYLLSKYSTNKVKEIIHNSGYVYYHKKHFFKLII